jgi:hypothetical protein
MPMEGDASVDRVEVYYNGQNDTAVLNEFRMARACYLLGLRQILLNRQRGKTTAMQPDQDSRKRPLLTAEQLRKMSGVPEKPKKGSPREEFENLFRQSGGLQS